MPSLGPTPNLELGPSSSSAIFFFCSYKASLGAERSSEGAQGVKPKPRENLGCLAPFFSLA